MIDRIIADLSDSRIKRRGLSISGGDPLYPANLSAILDLVQRVKQAVPEKDIWMHRLYKKSVEPRTTRDTSLRRCAGRR